MNYCGNLLHRKKASYSVFSTEALKGLSPVNKKQFIQKELQVCLGARILHIYPNKRLMFSEHVG